MHKGDIDNNGDAYEDNECYNKSNSNIDEINVNLSSDDNRIKIT